MIGFYIAANVGKYLFRSSAKYGYTGLIGGGLISKAGRGVGMAVRGKYQKLGDAIYKFFNEGGIGHSLLAGKRKNVDTITSLSKANMGSPIPDNLSRYSPELGLDREFNQIIGKAISGQKLSVRDHRRIVRTLDKIEDTGSMFADPMITGGRPKLEAIRKYSASVVSQHNKRFIRAGLITAGSAYIASLTSRKAFEAMQAVESNALNFAASIGEYEAVRAIPMMNTMQATTERAAALQYIQQSRTNARSLLGQEAALRHGV